MRNGQNNKNLRMRNRNNNHGGGNNNNHRRNQNPMTRVFESNGPDIKIRGTASHVAEKYVQLARDARTSGDPVAAENYYQHAEHYFRLIAAAQEQFRQTQPQPRADGEMTDDSGGEDESENFSHFGAEPGFAPQPPQVQPQPQPSFQPRDQQNQPRDNHQSRESYPPREQRQPREFRPQPSFQPPSPPAAADDAGVDRLPSFITGPQANGQGSAQGNAPVGGPANGQPPASEGNPGGERERFPRRRRRPHVPRAESAADTPAPLGDDFNSGNS